MNPTSEVIFLTNANNSLRKKIEDLTQKQKKLVGAHKKELGRFNLTMNKNDRRQTQIRSKQRYKKKIKTVLELFNSQLKDFDQELDSVNIKPVASEVNSVSGDSSSNFQINFVDRNEHAPTDYDCLFSKDVARIPDKKYACFRKNLKLKIGSLYRVKKFRGTCGLKFKPIIKKLSTGYYIDPVLKIKEQILNLLQAGDIKFGEKIWVKVSCDGTNVSRNVTLVNMVLNIINEQTKAATASGCYRVGMFKIDNENYECVKQWLPIIWDKVKGLQQVFYDKVEKRFLDESESVFPINKNTEVFDMEYFFSADWKMMAIILGLTSANSKFPCLFCETDDLSKKGKDREFQTTLNPDPKCNHGYKHFSLIIDIPFDRFIIDILHQFLRISELLMALFLDKLAYSDKISNEDSKFNPDKHKCLNILSKFFTDECKMNLIEPDKSFKDIKLKIKNLMGPRKRIILQNITSESTNIQTMFAEYLPEAHKIHNLWKDYYKLNVYFRSEVPAERFLIKETTAGFLKDFCSLYHKKKITPYLHAICHHLPHQVDRFGNLNYFSAQGLEKLNDLTTNEFFLATNKASENNLFILQILQRDLRISYKTNQNYWDTALIGYRSIEV